VILFFSCFGVIDLDLKHSARMWPTRAFCAARDDFWEFSNSYSLYHLVYSTVLESDRLASEQVPN